MKVVIIVFILLISNICFGQSKEEIKTMVEDAMNDPKRDSWKIDASQKLNVTNLYLQIQNLQKEISIIVERELWRKGISEEEFKNYIYNYQSGIFTKVEQKERQ